MSNQETFEHKDESFTLSQIGEREWKVTDSFGRNCGTLVRVAGEGEEHEPVFGVIRPADHEPYMEGSDSDALIRALLNEVETL